MKKLIESKRKLLKKPTFHPFESEKERKVWLAAIREATRAACLGRGELNGMIERLKRKDGAPQIWLPANVYPTAKLGKHTSVGMFSEIGHGVHVGQGTRIGAMSFIPEGVWIGENVFIGPRVTFTNPAPRPSGSERSWRTERALAPQSPSCRAFASVPAP
jgi:hypothetical protein